MKIKAIVRYSDCEDEDNCFILGFSQNCAVCFMENGELRNTPVEYVTIIDTNYLDLFKEKDNEL